MRLIDAYSGVLGAHAFIPGEDNPVDVSASRFLRPCAGRLAPFHPLHLAAIKRGMTVAAESGQGYHLWWHPHNFGCNLDLNIAGLSALLDHYRYLHEQFSMRSSAMEDF